MESIREQFKKALNEIDKSGNKNCINCSFCKKPGKFAKCEVMYLSENGYILKPLKDHTGFGYGDSAYISLLIENGDFPNKNGNCQHYKKIWWKFWIKNGG
jgi:hypothetical protein